MAEERPRFETTDMSIRIVGLTAIVLLVFLCLTPVLLSFIYSSAIHGIDRGRPTQLPQPQLQLNPRNDLAKLRAAEQSRLESYGWVDRSKGIVHIPIEQAMQAVAQRGIPDFRRPPP